MEAWYTATAQAQVNYADPVTGSITTAASTKDMAGSFTITPSAIGDKTNVALTDENGVTWVSVSDGNGGYTQYQASSSGALYVTYSLAATVTYSGQLSDEAAIQALWESTCASVTLTLSCTVASGTAAVGAASTSDIHYITASDDFSDKANGNVINKAANLFDFGTPSGSGTYTSSAELSFGSVLVAVRGSNSVVWTGEDASHKPSYTMSCAATHTAVQ